MDINNITITTFSSWKSNKTARNSLNSAATFCRYINTIMMALVAIDGVPSFTKSRGNITSLHWCWVAEYRRDRLFHLINIFNLIIKHWYSWWLFHFHDIISLLRQFKFYFKVIDAFSQVCVIIEEEKLLSSQPIAGACDNKYALISILLLAAMTFPNEFKRLTWPSSFAVLSNIESNSFNNWISFFEMTSCFEGVESSKTVIAIKLETNNSTATVRQLKLNFLWWLPLSLMRMSFMLCF